MRRSRCGCLLTLGMAMLGSAGCGEADETLVTHELYVMATRIELALPGEAARDGALLGRIERELLRFERDYYAWGDGELRALNRSLSASRPFEASDTMAGVLETAGRISRATGGAFDPGVGALVELWGFNAGEPAAGPPDADAIEAVLARSGSVTDLVIDGTTIDVAPGRDGLTFTLDLGGIAKGAAVDSIVAMLEAAGVPYALVNAGGDLRVVGERPGRGWRIGVQSPRGTGLIGTIALEAGEAAFTSGDYARFIESDGERLHHILDPATGYPAMHTQAVTVIAGDGTTADAAATALLVAGPGEWRRVAGALGIAAVLRVDAAGEVETTSAMRERYQPSARARSDIIAAAD